MVSVACCRLSQEILALQANEKCKNKNVHKRYVLKLLLIELNLFNLDHSCKIVLTHSRVQISNLACYAISVGDLDMLMWARVNHHVPWVAIQSIGPVIVALYGPEIKCLTFENLKFFLYIYHSYTGLDIKTRQMQVDLYLLSLLLSTLAGWIVYTCNIIFLIVVF